MRKWCYKVLYLKTAASIAWSDKASQLKKLLASQLLQLLSFQRGKYPELQVLLTEPSWREALAEHFTRPYWTNLKKPVIMSNEVDSPTDKHIGKLVKAFEKHQKQQQRHSASTSKEVEEDDNAKASNEREKELAQEHTIDDVDYGEGVRKEVKLFVDCKYIQLGTKWTHIPPGRRDMLETALQIYFPKWSAVKLREEALRKLSQLKYTAKRSAKTKEENAVEGKIPASPFKEGETQGRAKKDKVTAKDFVNDEARQGLNNTNDNEEDEEEDDDGGGDEEAFEEEATAKQVPKGRAARAKAARENAAREKTAREKAAKEKAAKEKAAASKSDKDKSADEEDADDGDEDDEEATDKDEGIVHATKEKAGKDKAANEKAAKEQAAKARAAKAANTKAAKKQAAKAASTTAAKNKVVSPTRMSARQAHKKASQQLVARNEESPSPEDEVQGFFQFKDEDAVLLWSSKSKVPVAKGTVEALSEEAECRVHKTVLKVGEVPIWVRKVLVPDTRILVNTNDKEFLRQLDPDEAHRIAWHVTDRLCPSCAVRGLGLRV
eukprot:jgi/Chlat1/424/Chrsp102S00940